MRWPAAKDRPGLKPGLATFLSLAAGAAALLLLVIGATLRAPLPVAVDVEMATTTVGQGRVFSASAEGYSERRVVAFSLQSDGRPHRYRVPLAGRVPTGIRLDPGEGRGNVELHAVRFSVADRSADARLPTDVRVLNDLVPQSAGAGAIRLRADGDSPQFEVIVPEQLRHWQRSRSRTGAWAFGMGVLLLAGCAWSRRVAMWAVIRASARNPWVLAVMAAMATVLALDALGVGCDGGLCSARGVGYGSALFLSALAMAAVGGAVLRLLDRRAAQRCQPFLWLGIGQATLMLYVLVRSAVHAAIPALPLADAEMPVLAIGAIACLASRSGFRACVANPRARRWLLLELGVLAAVCVVVADRELPRQLMLSSDPDFHAYLARQVGLAGGIPWRGEGVFHYPAGTAALTWAWSRLSLLDVRNALTALPLLESLLAALILGEAVAMRIADLRTRAVVLLTVLLLTAAAFLVPVFSPYSHMEGTGRQIAIGFMALVPVVAVAGRWRTHARVLLVALALFALAVLNPVNVLAPCLLVACAAAAGLLQRKGSGWLVAACPLMLLGLLLDPYYQALPGGDAGASKITLSSHLGILSFDRILAGWRWQLLHRFADFAANLAALVASKPAPLFVLFACGLFVAWRLQARRGRITWPMLAIAVAGIAALFAADALFAALAHDRRFYLLGPYFGFNVQQAKFLVLSALAALVVGGAANATTPVRRPLAAGALIVVVIGTGMRLLQPMSLEPRWNDCGSLGCLTDDDRRVMRDFAAYAERGGVPPGTRVLVPNSLHHAANEAWIFPVSGARALPFATTVPVAFFYYQGDDAFTTKTYVEHVCRTFDREWLRARRVAFVFLPTGRGSACMAGQDALPRTDRILFRSGLAYLVELR